MPPTIRKSALVCGLARSGCSLVMHMIRAGGAAIYTNDPAFLGHPDALKLPGDPTWRPKMHQKVVKIIDPDAHRPVGMVTCRRIFVSRKPSDLYDSQIKAGVEPRPSSPRQLAERQERARAICMTDRDFMELHFSDILRDPYQAACRINTLFGCGMDVLAMRDAVRHQRVFGCAPDMSTERFLMNQAESLKPKPRPKRRYRKKYYRGRRKTFKAKREASLENGRLDLPPR